MPPSASCRGIRAALALFAACSATVLADEPARRLTPVESARRGEERVDPMRPVRLSAEEREYYDIFLAYLLAAWSGRVDSTKLPPPTPAPELDGFFE